MHIFARVIAIIVYSHFSSMLVSFCKNPVYLYCTCIVPVLYLYCTCIEIFHVGIILQTPSVPVLYLYCTCIVPVLYLYCTVLRYSMLVSSCRNPVYLYCTCIVLYCTCIVLYCTCIVPVLYLYWGIPCWYLLAETQCTCIKVYEGEVWSQCHRKETHCEVFQPTRRYWKPCSKVRSNTWYVK